MARRCYRSGARSHVRGKAMINVFHRHGRRIIFLAAATPAENRIKESVNKRLLHSSAVSPYRDSYRGLSLQRFRARSGKINLWSDGTSHVKSGENSRRES